MKPHLSSNRPYRESTRPLLPAYTIITCFVVLMIVGLALIPFLSIRLEPSRTFNTISIRYGWPKRPALMLEQEVTAKVEGVLSTVRGVRSIRSVSADGYGQVQVTLEDHTNIGQARYEIATLIRQLYNGLPEGVSFPVVNTSQPSDNNKSILIYTINGSGTAAAVQQWAEKVIKPKLVLLKGVYQVNLYGANPYGWEFRYSPEVLERCGVTANDIAAALSNYFKEFELGKAYSIDTSGPAGLEYNYLTLRTDREDPIAWNKIPVKSSSGRMLYLTDLAAVRYSEQEAHSYYRINGRTAINMEIVAARDINYLVLAGQIKEQLRLIGQGNVQGYSVDLAYDATQYLKQELTKIAWRSMATVIILLLFVLAVSRQLRYSLFILVSLISNLLLAFILYYVFKLEIHLYSLAAITVSMGMIIDNSIVVIDHIRHKNNLRIMLPVTGTTLTSIGAVCIVFFLDEQQQVRLLDFAWVVIINLVISLLIALFFIPALMERLPSPRRRLITLMKRKRRAARWNRVYANMISFIARRRSWFIAAAILLFGLPIFMLPRTIKSATRWGRLYNATIGSGFYDETLRPVVDKGLGGFLRLFLSHSKQFSFQDAAPERTNLTVGITMPRGASIEQMNDLVMDWEHYLERFPEIGQFRSWVGSGQNAEMNILFKTVSGESTFPYMLKSLLESRAAYTGLAEFTITGAGPGFNNELNTEPTHFGITLQGYNYEELHGYAEKTRDLLQDNPRVEKINISSQRDWRGEKSNYEYLFRVKDPERLLVTHLSPRMISDALTNFSGEKNKAGYILYKGDYVPLILTPVNGPASIWRIMNQPVRSDSGAYVRLKELATLDKEKAGDRIFREDQQYQLVVNYDFNGDNDLAFRISDEAIQRVKADLPLGYSIQESDQNFWQGSEDKLIWAILVTIGIVFIISSVLLNNLVQALIVIAMIPVSFIGVFITASLFEYKFDEGGYAAFIILCGVVVNSALFILNDYNYLLRNHPLRSKKALFIRAYNSRIIPVSLSITSMILGLAPFLVHSRDEAFWHALAMSVTGGLSFSVIAIVVFLPLFLKGMKVSRS